MKLSGQSKSNRAYAGLEGTDSPAEKTPHLSTSSVFKPRFSRAEGRTPNAHQVRTRPAAQVYEKAVDTELKQMKSTQALIGADQIRNQKNGAEAKYLKLSCLRQEPGADGGEKK